MKKILGIQFRKNPITIKSEQESIVREAGDILVCDFIDALDTSQPWHDPKKIVHGYDGIILGGSGDFDFDGGRPIDDAVRVQSQQFLQQLEPLFDYVFAERIPTLGICYGHQIIGAYRGASVHHDVAQHKIGTHTIVMQEASLSHPLFKNVPREIQVQYGHKDVLDRVPDGAELLATGARCAVSALCYGGVVYTTQFHPEMTAEDVHARLSHGNGYLPSGMRIDDLVQPSPYGTTLFRNYFTWIANRQA